MTEGAQSTWGVVRWAKDPFEVKEHMDGLTEDDGSHVRDNTGIVKILMRKVFGEDSVVELDDARGDGADEVQGMDRGTPDVNCGGLSGDMV